MPVPESTAEAVLVIGLYANPTDNKFYTPLTRSGTHRSPLWRIPGGGIEPGETKEQAAARELAEEVGTRVVELLPFKKIQKPSRDLMHKEHIQYALTGVIESVSDFRQTAHDGNEILINELFELGRIRNAIKYRGLLSHYDILPYHETLLKELFDKLFGEL